MTFTLLISVQCYSQSSDCYEIVDDVLRINPREIPAAKGNTVKKPLLMVYEIAQKSDSVAMLMTVFSKSATALERIKILCYDRVSYSSQLERISVATQKKLHEATYRCYISKQNFQNLYSIDDSFMIDLNKEMKFGLKPSKWKKEQQTMNQIIKAEFK